MSNQHGLKMNDKLISFTQTYGNRPILIDIYSRDERLIEFKNLFDINIYSFHNVNTKIQNSIIS